MTKRLKRHFARSMGCGSFCPCRLDEYLSYLSGWLNESCFTPSVFPLATKMSSSPQENPKLIIDDDWKERVQAEKAAASQPQATAKADEQPKVPPASFATLIHSLTAQTLSALGQLPDTDGQPKVHLDLAKHLIDTLGLIEEKTKGNLTPDESELLSQVLYELRMLFVHVRTHGLATGGGSKQSPLLDA